MYPSQTLAQSNASFMSRVYVWMMLALAISGSVAYTVGNNPAMVKAIFSSSFNLIILIVLQFAAVIALSARIEKMSVGLSSIIYIAYAALTGLTFSTIFMAYTSDSICQAFFISAAGFAGLSVFGFVTKRDLGPVGSFCMMGLFGLIGFMLITLIFPSIQSNALSQTISILSILIFAGLTAYDTQQIKQFNTMASSPEAVKKAALIGALRLYLDFINLFLSVLRLFGDRR